MLTKSISWLLALSLIAFTSIADTYVYLTNNSDQPLTLQVAHDGTDRLKYGEQWQQYEEKIGPWETKKVLGFNRWVGVKSNQTYRFHTVISNSRGESTTLRQVMRGYWYNSAIEFGVSAADVESSLKSDREIHRSETQSFGDLTTELAFKSSSTVMYDDLHYTITPAYPAEPVDNNEQHLKVLSYNIWALPAIAADISQRFEIIPEYVHGYDVIAFQEVFASGRQAFLQTLASEYPYQTEILSNGSYNIHDGGVVIVSRHPIVNEAQFVFPECSGSDCFADKGVVYAEIIKDGLAYHLFATHAASHDTDQARHNRQLQFKHIRALATSLEIPSYEPVIYSGDFNVNKRKFPDDYQQMLANLNAAEPQYSGYIDSTFDPRINSYAGQALTGSENVEYLDYIFVSNEYGQRSYNNNRVDVPRTTDQRLWQQYNLSDHFPVSADIRP
ncbi:sphingomyelin phosphodiesterase [Vibrio sagamiensis]|uniref:Phospholipase C n=1 Tax=Vibrio sagamiensis NBRC 104589 TaxID=1219064 RepID=A0A511QBN6_9VIBR|nr:sphingomyelin phosphodiesterase [Vibrio sagamiensis]PNQ54232.1 phospholipase [Vibrio agarivorans]GEM74688.1 phospholipase C [Vibrio sagamiensis NBRC 104589]